jgi:DNA-binding MurR/RpiR family transcriptional regulator
MISDNVKTIASNSASETFEQIYRVSKDDVVIAISYPRYSVRTLNAVKYAASKNSTIISITDNSKAPINAFSTYSLIADSDMTNFVDSLVAPLSLCNALVVALVIRNKDKIAKTFSDLENIWVDYEVYEQKNFDN